jgi:hypothetical protein
VILHDGSGGNKEDAESKGWHTDGVFRRPRDRVDDVRMSQKPQGCETNIRPFPSNNGSAGNAVGILAESRPSLLGNQVNSPYRDFKTFCQLYWPPLLAHNGTMNKCFGKHANSKLNILDAHKTRSP